MEKLIELTSRKLSLLEELRESIIYESKTYHLVCKNDLYMLYRISDEKQIKTGRKGEIESYFRLRGVNLCDVYGAELIQKSTPVIL